MCQLPHTFYCLHIHFVCNNAVCSDRALGDRDSGTTSFGQGCSFRQVAHPLERIGGICRTYRCEGYIMPYNFFMCSACMCLLLCVWTYECVCVCRVGGWDACVGESSRAKPYGSTKMYHSLICQLKVSQGRTTKTGYH